MQMRTSLWVVALSCVFGGIAGLIPAPAAWAQAEVCPPAVTVVAGPTATQLNQVVTGASATLTADQDPAGPPITLLRLRVNSATRGDFTPATMLVGSQYQVPLVLSPAGSYSVSLCGVAAVVAPPPPPPQTATLPAGATQCAPEDGTCTFTGAARPVYYGANGTYVSLLLPSPVACTNAVFGDPLVGVGKACYLAPTAAPVPTDAVVSAWSAWTGGAWSTCSASQQARTETRTRTVVTPASNGGQTPALSETRTASQTCVMPPVVVLPRVTLAVSACVLTATTTTTPDGTTGWGVQYQRNGNNHGSRDTSSPYERAATVTAGSYTLTAIWTKSGQATVTQALGAVVCD
ncbi:MAG: hypothetical protein ABL982_00215 [Vicinamibacterales bacterium]